MHGSEERSHRGIGAGLSCGAGGVRGGWSLRRYVRRRSAKLKVGGVGEVAGGVADVEDDEFAI